MKITIAAIGKAKAGPESALYTHYIKRIPWKTNLLELEEKKPLEALQRKQREGELLLAACAGAGARIVLDERGKALGSEEFAAHIQTFQTRGISHFAFLIGGADGHGKQVLDCADLLLSFGKLTWPHMLVRGMLAEQLYRAHTILTGHPYHRV